MRLAAPGFALWMAESINPVGPEGKSDRTKNRAWNALRQIVTYQRNGVGQGFVIRGSGVRVPQPAPRSR
jgi:hypothetical protein